MTQLNAPVMSEAKPITDAWTILPSWLPVPGLGVLAVNSFLLKCAEPVLVDTGLAALGGPFVSALQREIDLDDLRWIWISHMDADHVGNLERILEKAPNAAVVTNFLGMGKMQMAGLDVSRVRLLEPGRALEAGGHSLVPVRPPYYDAPETVGFFAPRERVFFAADSFGALLPAIVDDVVQVETGTLREGLVGWSSIDAPWLANVDRADLGRTLSTLDRLAPDFLLSAHLPVFPGDVSSLTRCVAEAYCHDQARTADTLSLDYVAETRDDFAFSSPTQGDYIMNRTNFRPATAGSTIERNRDTAQRFLSGTHSRDIADVEVIDETVGPDIVCHGFPGFEITDHETYKDFFRTFRKSFSDMNWTVHALVADENYVTARWEIQATFSGDFAGVKADGRRVTFDGMVMYRMENGLIAETWLHINELMLLRQIGALTAIAA